MTVTFERLPDQAAEHRKKPLTGYVVLVDSEPVGSVYQIEERWSRMAGRIRMRDYYPVRWSWSRRVERLGRRYRDEYPQDRRRWAVDQLLKAVAQTKPIDI